MPLKLRIFIFADFWLGQNMENDVYSYDMSSNKISQNPRKVIFTIAGSGDEQVQKTNIFFNSTSLKLSFALCHGILLPPGPDMAVFWATLLYI